MEGPIPGPAAAVYSLATTWMVRTVPTLKSSAALMALPTLARLQEDTVGFSNAYRRFVGLTAFLACPMVLGFGAVAPDAGVYDLIVDRPGVRLYRLKGLVGDSPAPPQG